MKIPAGWRRVREVSTIVGLNPSTIYRWIREGKLTARRLGRVLYVRTRAVQELKSVDRRGKADRAAPPPHGYISTNDAEVETGVPRRTIQHWAKTNAVRATRYGPKIWYVHQGDVMRLARKRLDA